MGEYTGRRRGRAASEPSAQQPEYPHGGQPDYQDPYAQYGHEQPAAEYQGYEYAQDPAYGYQEIPGYEQYQGYEQHPSYEQQPGYEQPPGYEQQPGYEQYPAYEQQGYYAQEYQPEYDQGYGHQEPYYQEAYQQEPYQQEGYQKEGYLQEGYQQEPYYEQPYEEAPPYSDSYAQPYAEPYSEQYSESEPYAEPYSQPYAEPYAEQPYAAGYPDEYADEYVDSYAYGYDAPEPRRPPLPLAQHLPFIAASTGALAITAFVSAKALAVVVLPLQLVVAWAILALAGHASRRTAVLAALPTLAGTAAVFKFQPDDAVLPLAAGLGVGFVLIAADAVFRARRRGVEPGSVRSLSAAASALLFAGLTGLFLPAAVLHGPSVAVGAAVCGLASLVAARNPDLGVSRAAVVAVPVTIAALASYAAAILVP